MAKLKDGTRIYGNVTIDSAAVVTTLNASTVNASTFVLSNGVDLIQLAQTGGSTSNDAYAQANTARGTANDAYAQANTARDTANNAYAAANNSNLKSGGTISGDLTVAGNLYLSLNTTLINVSTYQVEDPLIYLASNNQISDTIDIGFMGGKNNSGTYAHTGLVRHAADQKYYLFDGLAEEGHQNNVVDVANTYLATLRANIEANSITLVGNAVATSVNTAAAYGQANAAYSQANSAYGQANIVYGIANTAYGQANAAYGQANDAHSQANTARNTANDAYAGANTANTNALNAYGVANLAYNDANTRVLKAGDTVTGNLNVAASLITQNIVPNLNVTYNIGSSTKRFNDIWLSNSTIYLGDTWIKSSPSDANAIMTMAIHTQSGMNVEPMLQTIYGQANAAYGQANTGRDTANLAYSQANAAFTAATNSAQDAQNAQNSGNYAYAQANAAYGAANTANTNALSAYGQANAAYNQANNSAPSINIISGTSVTAIKNQHYVLTNAALTTVTLPATPSVGDSLVITVANGLLTNNVSPNGGKIANTTDNLTINSNNATIQLRYVSSGYGWLVG